MELKGVHLLLTYQCNLECEHCFVWGSPRQAGTMGLEQVREILRQSEALGTVEWIYFEGGEPFLYYPILCTAVREAAALGFEVGIVSNGYWATSREDALEWLRPLSGLVQDLSVSSDRYHRLEAGYDPAENACQAADELGIPVGTISIAEPEAGDAEAPQGQLPKGLSSPMYRGRASQALAERAPMGHWYAYGSCPHEDLRDPGRVHIDPLGYLHVCQGIVLGNVFATSLREIGGAYRPREHPITGPLLRGGPAELVRRYDLFRHPSHRERYADACHLCYLTRNVLRDRFPGALGPDQMYGAEGRTS